MKRRKLFWIIGCLVLLISLFLGLFFYERHKQKEPPPPRVGEQKEERYFLVSREKEIRAVWVNYMELSLKDVDQSREAFLKKAEQIVNNLCESGMNTVIIHVRPFCDAFYPSAFFPWSAYLTGTQGKALPYDPLALFLDCAKSAGLFVEAWINPYRVSLSQDFKSLAPENPARIWHEKGEDEHLIVCKKGIYLNPCSEKAKTLILNGVRELLTHYRIDAIHMDDYFYPTTDPSIDAAQYAAYQKNGGALTLADFRCAQVNSLLSSMYATIKATRPEVQFVISPGGNISYNKEKLYADVALWGKEEGYCDVLMPQIYYGFQNKSRPFEETARAWSSLVTNPKVKLCYALGAYKCGTEDGYAKNGQKEWKENTDILARQLAFCRTLPKYDGVAFYGYTNIYLAKDNKIMQKEWKNLKNMLK